MKTYQINGVDLLAVPVKVQHGYKAKVIETNIFGQFYTTTNIVRLNKEDAMLDADILIRDEFEL
jgi:hypothetical protein